MHRPVKYVEKGLSVAAKGAWVVFDALNKINRNPAFTPSWSDKPLLKSWEKVKPPLGWPRETDSLCPTCVREARQAILDGKKDVSVLLNEKVGEIKATILERDGKILMVKDCPIHGHFEDVMAIDTAFFKHLEDSFPGSRHPRAQRREAAQPRQLDHQVRPRLGADDRPDQPLQHDVRPLLHGREPGRVRPRAELGRHQDAARQRHHASSRSGRCRCSSRAASRRCRPTSSTPSATRRRSATTACRRRPTASSSPRARSSRKAAAEAGLRYAYLQFDGIGNAANAHRLVGNLFDVKLRAIENLWSAGVDIVPVMTIVNGVNNEQVGRIIQFAIDNPKKISFLSFQPVSFTGRDEEVTPERRAAQRYTLSHLAHDVKNQTGIGEPTRDWFPISFMGTFGDWADLVHGPAAEWGHLSCGCHPNCGIGMAMMVDKETKEAVPVTAFLNGHQLAKDVARVNDAARGKCLSMVGMALAVMRNYDSFKTPTHFRLADLLKPLRQGVRRHRQGLRQGDARAGRWPTSRSAARTGSTSCSSPGCGSRTSSTTTSAGPSAASSPTRRSRARSASAPTTRASAGGTSSRRCT